MGHEPFRTLSVLRFEQPGPRASEPRRRQQNPFWLPRLAAAPPPGPWNPERSCFSAAGSVPLPFSCRSPSEGSGTFLALPLLFICGLRIRSLCLLQSLLSGSPMTDAHSGARILNRASRVSTGLALLPLVGLGATCTPRLVFAPLGEDFWASAYPHAPWAWVPGSRHTCSPCMEQRCHLNPLHPLV